MTSYFLLNAGSGPIGGIDRLPAFFRSSEWREVRLDINPAAQPDIVASIVDLSSIKPQSIDAIWCSHNLEHLYDHQVVPALREFLRILKPDGFLYLKVPDLQVITEFIAANGADKVAYESTAGPITPLDMIYGHRASVAAGNLHMAHHTGFTPSTLERSLEAAGFPFGVLKRQAYMEVSALAFKSASDESGRRESILAELGF